LHGLGGRCIVMVMNLNKVPKEVRRVLLEAESQGFSLKLKTKGVQVFSPTGKACAMVHGSPNPWAANMLIRDLAKAGYTEQGRKRS
jgi:hypothetical protein